MNAELDCLNFIKKSDPLKTVMDELEKPPEAVYDYVHGHLSEILLSYQFNPKALTMAAIKYCNKCAFEADESEKKYGKPFQQAITYQKSLYRLLELFLENGMDPNDIFHDDNVISSVIMNADGEHIGAQCLKLLLEHGANPNLIVDGESIFENLDFDIVFDVYELDNKVLYDSRFYMWLVMVGYGGKVKQSLPIKLKEGFDITCFRDYENYTFTIEFTNKNKEGWIMHIFDQDKKEEVAWL